MTPLKKLSTVLIIVLLLIVGGVFGVAYKYPTQTRSAIASFMSTRFGITSSTTINQPQIVVEEESAVINAVGKVSSSVVSVVASQTGINPFSGETSTREQGIGTGFIVDASGVILTNKHVVSDSTISYTVLLKDKTSFAVKKVYLDPVNDLAIIKVDATGLTPVTLGDSSTLKVGQTVIAIGNALGRFDNTVTKGVVSALGRGITASSGNPFSNQSESLEDVIQTDASLNPGNSGGPLANLSGQVIGINSAVSSGAQGIGFAIPINTAKPVLDSFAKTGKIVRPFLGVTYELVTGDLALFTRLPVGALVRSIVADSPAEKADIRKGDVIVSVAGEKVTDIKPLSQIVLKHAVGESITVVIDRGGSSTTLTATLAEAPGS